MPRPNQKRSMHAIRSDCIGGREFPAGKNRLHNLIAKSHPFDAIEQRGFAHAGQRRPFQAEHDFRLDARFDKILHPQNTVLGVLMHGVVGDIPQMGDRTP